MGIRDRLKRRIGAANTSGGVDDDGQPDDEQKRSLDRAADAAEVDAPVPSTIEPTADPQGPAKMASGAGKDADRPIQTTATAREAMELATGAPTPTEDVPVEPGQGGAPGDSTTSSQDGGDPGSQPAATRLAMRAGAAGSPTVQTGDVSDRATDTTGDQGGSNTSGSGGSDSTTTDRTDLPDATTSTVADQFESQIQDNTGLNVDLDSGDVTRDGDEWTLTEQGRADVRSARASTVADQFESQIGTDVDLDSDDVTRDGDQWVLSDEGRADVRSAAEASAASNAAGMIDDRYPGIDVTSEDVSVSREFTAGFQGGELTPGQLSAFAAGETSATQLSVSLDEDVQAQLADAQAAGPQPELGADPQLVSESVGEQLERAVEADAQAAQMQGEDAVLTPSKVQQADVDLQRGEDFLVEDGDVVWTETGRQEALGTIAEQQLEETFGGNIQAGEDFTVTEGGQVELTEDFRREQTAQRTEQALEAEYGGDFEAGEDFTLTTLPQGEIPGAPESGQPDAQFDINLTDEGRQQVAGSAETGETWLDENVINPALGAEPRQTASPSGVPVVFPSVFSGGEGDAVQQAEAFLEEQSTIHETGEGWLPSGEQAANFAQRGRQLDDDGVPAAPAAGPGIGAFGNAPTGFWENWSRFTEGAFRRFGRTANPAGIALGAGRLGESTGEFAFNAAGSVVAPSDQQRETFGERRQAQTAAATAALGTLADNTIGGFQERPVETVGSAGTELAFLYGSAALSPLRFGRARIATQSVDAATDAGSSTLYRGLVLDAPPAARRFGFNPDPQPLIGVTGRGPSLASGSLSVAARADPDASPTQRIVTRSTRPEIDIERPRIETPPRDEFLKPALGTPDLDISGPRMTPNTAGDAPSRPLETTIYRRNLRSQLSGDDLTRFEAGMTLRSLATGVPISRRLGRRLGFRRRATDIETGVRESRLIPDRAADDVTEALVDDDAVFGGSANQLIQTGRARTPEDIDIYRAADSDIDDELASILGSATDRPIRQRGGLEIQTGDGWEHLVDINPLERGVSGINDWNLRLSRAEPAPGGGQIQPLESQLANKLEGSLRLFGDDTIAPKTWRAKDVFDVEAVAGELIERNKRSLNPLRQLRARRAESALADWRQSFGDLDLPEESFQGWDDLAASFQTTEVSRPGVGATVRTAADDFLTDTRGQATLSGFSDDVRRADTDTDTGTDLGGGRLAQRVTAGADSRSTSRAGSDLLDASDSRRARSYPDADSQTGRYLPAYAATVGTGDYGFASGGETADQSYPSIEVFDADYAGSPAFDYDGLGDYGGQPADVTRTYDPTTTYDGPGAFDYGFVTIPAYTPPGEPGTPGGPETPIPPGITIPGTGRPPRSDDEDEEDQRRRESETFGIGFEPGERPLNPGWLSETVTDFALGISLSGRSPGEETLEEFQAPTGEFPTAAMVSGDERVEDALDIFAPGFGVGGGDGGSQDSGGFAFDEDWLTFGDDGEGWF